MSRRRPGFVARGFAVPSAGLALTGAAPTSGTQPWLVVGLVFFGVAAVALLAAVGVKMRRTPGPPPQRPPGEEAADREEREPEESPRAPGTAPDEDGDGDGDEDGDGPDRPVGDPR